MLKSRTKFIKGYLFAIPLLVVLAVAVLFPALYNLEIAFSEYNGASNSWRFAGLQNFAKLWNSAVFWNSFKVTLLWVAGNVSLQLIIGLGIALALNSIIRFRGPFTGILLIPWISSFVVVGILFLWIYDPQMGVLNDVLLRLGLIEKPVAWLASPQLAQASLIAANTIIERADPGGYEIADIRKADIVRTRVLCGWGVHWTPADWLYNVAGRWAVRLELGSERPVMIGTGDTRGLHDAIEAARAQAAPRNP